jgi:hypothetical protein
MKRACLFLVLAFFGVSPAQSQQGIRLPSLDEYCRLGATTLRETIVYIDGSAAKSPQAAEIATVITKKSGLAPRERVRVFFVHSNDGAREVFNKCWPELTPDELKARNNPTTWSDRLRGWLDESPETKLNDTKEFFKLGIQNAIGAQSATQPTAIDLARVLSADKDRLPQASKVYRVLIFGQMKSEQLKGFASARPSLDETDALDKFFQTFPISLNGADVYAWGMTSDDDGSAKVGERIWRAYFQKGFANLKSFSFEFPIPTPVVVTSLINLSGKWESTLGTGQASMVLATTSSGTLISSWLTLQNYPKTFAVPLEGSYSCKSAKDCTLSGHISASVPYLRGQPFFVSGDLVELSGDPATALRGTIRPSAQARFPDGKPASYQLSLHN